ncbi:hypothetical protein HPB52_000933 [Rhipicephalus sanguineus]|uniref:Uncharacterized protein n=1 Tax=Rhipicephalus sanguineus TaxID=34632 RepID=A0A9D4PKW6_RHISA|nr:hypothetical protein HPB52_000933 [Rhipicephalus sanguineus]
MGVRFQLELPVTSPTETLQLDCINGCGPITTWKGSIALPAQFFRFGSTYWDAVLSTEIFQCRVDKHGGGKEFYEKPPERVGRSLNAKTPDTSLDCHLKTAQQVAAAHAAACEAVDVELGDAVTTWVSAGWCTFLERSETLKQWQRLATPGLGDLFEDQGSGVRLKGGLPVQPPLQAPQDCLGK